jgi:predicted nucleic acid-binding protein
VGLADELRGKKVAIDSAPLIYFIERQEPHLSELRPFFELVEAGEVQLICSVVTLLEVLVAPIKRGDEARGQQYQDILLTSPNVNTVEVTVEIAQVAAEIRAENRLKTADAIQLATAIHKHADCFLTNDRDFGSTASMSIRRLSEFLP